MKNRVLILCLVVMVLPGCMGFYAVQPVHYEGSYKGRIVSAETGEPLAGVVVLAAWYKRYAGAGGTFGPFYDAREVVTDGQGDFTLPGMGPRLMSFLGFPGFVIFKAGYEHMLLGEWESLKDDLSIRDKIRWEGEKAIIPLRRLTLEERKKQGTPQDPIIPNEKIPLMIREVNKDRIENGLEPL